MPRNKILKSLIRTLFIEFSLDSFFDNVKKGFLTGFDKGESIPWNTLTPGMRISKITEVLGQAVYEHHNCQIIDISPHHVEFVCEYVIYKADSYIKDFVPFIYEHDKNDRDWVNPNYSEFYL